MGIEAEDGMLLGVGDTVLCIATIEKLRILFNNKNHCIIIMLLYTSTTINVASGSDKYVYLGSLHSYQL